VSCDEPYAIFCEDDVDFVSINYWNFTWDEFMTNLPEDWECVQLMRMDDNWSGQRIEHILKLEMRWGRWWGSQSLMRRSYVRRLLDKYCTGYNSYSLDIWHNDTFYIPIVENVLFMGTGVVYNFPMLIESQLFDTTLINKDVTSHNYQQLSHEIILNQWRTHGHELDITAALVPRATLF
jgi:hypothetical protein